jgi:hypothetical protein
MNDFGDDDPYNHDDDPERDEQEAAAFRLASWDGLSADLGEARSRLSTMRRLLHAVAEDKPIMANVNARAILQFDQGTEGVVITNCNFRGPDQNIVRLHKWWTWPVVGGIALGLGALLGRKLS